MVNESEPVRGQRRVKSRTVVYILFFVGIIAILGGFVWLRARLQHRAIQREIQNRLNAIRLAGEPVDLRDLAKLYPDPPADRDAVRLLQPALAAMVVPEESTNLPFFGGDWPKGNAPFERPMLDELRNAVATNQHAFDSVPWEKLKTAWIGAGYQNGFTNLTPGPLSKINSLVKLLCLDASLKAENQQPKEAVQSLARAAVIRQTLRNDTVLHGVVKLTQGNWICESLNRVLNRTALSDSDLLLLSDVLMQTNVGITKDLLINERAFGVSVAEYLQSLPPSAVSKSSLERLVNTLKGNVIYRDQDLLNYLDDCDGYLPILTPPLSNAIPKAVALDKTRKLFLIRRHSKLFSFFQSDRVSALSEIEISRVSPLLIQHANLLTYTRVARTALTIERWRLSHDGHLPDSLSDLVPAFLSFVPTDPFDERPLRYKKIEHGYIIYSIGPDFTDDGGKEKTASMKESDHYDIVFSVTR